LKPAYTKFLSIFQSLFLCAAITAAALLPAGCKTTGASQQPSGAQIGVVTDDPNSMPNIGWQTWHQRQTLSREDQAIAAQQSNPAAAELRSTPVKVALLLPMSGRSGDLGQAMLKAAQLALFDVGGTAFELVPLDTQSTPQGAADAARQAAAARSDLILGPIFADDVRAAKPIAASANIPMIAFTTDWKLAGGDTYVMGFLPFAQVSRVAQYAQSRGLNRFAVYAPQTEYCDVVIGTLQRSGAQIVRTGRYAAGETALQTLVQDFAQQAASVDANGNPAYIFDTLMLPVGGESLRTLVSLFDLSGINNNNIRLIGTGLWDDESLTRNPALYGGWFAAPDPALRRDFDKRYLESYGSAPPRLATLAYDATALAAVLSRGTHDKPYSRQRLTNPRGFAGIDGVFRLRPDGLNDRGLAVLEVQSGRARVIDAAPTAFVGSGS
jgi:branched-chain amino acid transport system substrate-binding protein